ncbi:MAG: hypothetical protein U9Q72_02145 [Patescibacteria group bacterium]|nr:hypothetical protein [Patescibacteria group bacterium]
MTEQIKKVIAESSLTQEEKDEFNKIIAKANTAQLQALESLFSENPEFAPTFYKNYKDKLATFTEKDGTQWDKIIDEEKGLMSS